MVLSVAIWKRSHLGEKSLCLETRALQMTILLPAGADTKTYPWCISQGSLTVAVKSLVWWVYLLTDSLRGRTFPLCKHYRFLPTTDNKNRYFWDETHHLFLSICRTVTGCDLCSDLSRDSCPIILFCRSDHIFCRSDVRVFPLVILSKEVAFIEPFQPEKQKLILPAVPVSGCLSWK